MAFTFGFFNSVNGDRLYNADQMSKIFEGLITDGIYESVGNKLAVQPNSGMLIQVATGRGWFNKRWVNNDSPYPIALASADQVLNRYGAVIIKVNASDSERKVELTVKYSDFATDPVKPTMERGEFVNEYCLAYIYIPAKATTITYSNIEDTRNDPELCGWVTGLIDQIDINTLYTQFTSLFNDWFRSIQDLIDENVATMLVGALPKSVTVTLNKDEWVDNQITVEVLNMNTTKNVIIDVDGFNDYGIDCIEQGDRFLTFKCTNTPTEDVEVKVLHLGV